MVREPVCCVRTMILLYAWMVLRMLLLLMRVLVLKVIHHLDSPSPTRAAVNATMLPLMSLIEHAKKTLCRRVRTWRSGRRRRIRVEAWSNAVGWCCVSGYLVTRMMRLGMLWVIVVPSTLLWKSVTIGHLIPPQSKQAAALAQNLSTRRGSVCGNLEWPK